MRRTAGAAFAGRWPLLGESACRPLFAQMNKIIRPASKLSASRSDHSLIGSATGPRASLELLVIDHLLCPPMPSVGLRKPTSEFVGLLARQRHYRLLKH